MKVCRIRRLMTLVSGALLFVFLLCFWHLDDVPTTGPRPQLPVVPFDSSERLNITDSASADQLGKVHLLLPAVSGRVNLCKTILSASALGYPVPTILSYKKTFTESHLVGGGRHVAKLEAISEWIRTMPASSNDDIAVVVDAYGSFNNYEDVEGIEKHMEGDAWFQLPLEVLIDRYNAIIRRANADLAMNLGKAYDASNIRAKIVFGSNKRCTPNNVQSVSCYPIPETPLPSDLYSQYTDALPTEEGQPRYSAYRQRFLNSGFIVGPVGDLRHLFRRALGFDKVSKPPAFDTSEAAARLHTGSDQAIFSSLFGEQEYAREVLRRKHNEPPRRRNRVLDTNVRDILKPRFVHETTQYSENGDSEFGITVDYWSDIDAQTVDNEDEGQWLTYNRPIESQLGRQRKPWSCEPRATGRLPFEVARSKSLPRSARSESSQFAPSNGWDEIPLYTNICLDTIPVVVNHNGDEKERRRDWPEMWMQPYARRLIDGMLARGDAGETEMGGAYNGPRGRYIGWEELCPARFDEEIYREIRELS